MPTHGSISKAGKVKWGGGKPTLLDKPVRKKNLSPKLANKRKFRLRDPDRLNRKPGQYHPY
jgi:ribosomal protein S30